jgi:zinc protease
LPGKDIIDVEKALNEEIERLQTKPVTAYELEKAKNQIESAFVSGQDSLFSQAMHLARYEISAGWRKIDDYIASVRKVTADDIKRVSNKYMVPDNRTIGILTPLSSKGKNTTGGPAFKEQIIR